MLPPEHRLRSSADFTDVVRRGRRASRPTLTVHLLAPAAETEQAGAGPARAGLVVSKAVGNSVVRHRTSRRLRHLLHEHVSSTLAPGSRLVVRAAPRAGAATSAELGTDLTAALARALGAGAVRPAAPVGP